MTLETPDYPVLCGQVEALLEGFFEAVDQQDSRAQAYYQARLRQWLTDKRAESARVRQAFEACAAHDCQQSELDPKKTGETVNGVTERPDSQLAKAGK